MANAPVAYAVPKVGDSANVYGTAYDGVPQDQTAYADPPPGAPYSNTVGWAPGLSRQYSSEQIPSAQRMATIPRYDYYPDPEINAGTGFYRSRDSDKRIRESVTDQSSGEGWSETKQSPGYYNPGSSSQGGRWAVNPRATPPPEPRVTSDLAPGNYYFTRPFDQFNRTYDGDPPTGSTRRFNGFHFSMADHRRDYPILGMTPPMIRRNTYRIEPTPWDVDVVDMPPNVDTAIPNGRVMSVEVPYPQRSYRL